MEKVGMREKSVRGGSKKPKKMPNKRATFHKERGETLIKDKKRERDSIGRHGS